MRNRPRAQRGATLILASALCSPGVLAGQVARHDLAEAAWTPPGAIGSGPLPVVMPAVSAPPGPPQAAIQWYHQLAFLGAMAALSPLDESVRQEAQASRSDGKDDVAGIARRFGQPEVYAVVALGTVTTGLLSGNSKITRAGGRITAALLVGGLASTSLKVLVGRQRPLGGEEQYVFHPFTKTDSWPSGHTTTAFALAASVSDEIRSTPVTIGLYSLATLTGWSRINDNKHWLTDVLAGAAIGVTSAKLMNGRWRVLGISAPGFLLEPSGGAGVAWRVEF